MTHEPLVRWNFQTREVARVTLCGSTRFRGEYELWNKRLTLAGFLVYSVAGFGHSGDHFSEAEKARLDQMHLAKIDASHIVVVINPGHYIGESTRREIEHATATGKPVFYTELGTGRYVYELRTGYSEERMRYAAFSWNPKPDLTGQDELAELRRQIAGYQHHLRECEQIAGKALGYPWFKDDQANFPGATEEAGVCIGEHVGDTIVAELAAAYAKRGELINRPEVDDFAKGVQLEAAHQVERYGVEHDAGKAPLDWFWLLGYLAQKAATAAVAGDVEKAKHHTISTAAALANWHALLSGRDTGMRPGIEPPATVEG